MKATGLLTADKPLPMRWIIVGMAFLATLLNYVHRLSFNYLSADGDLRKLIPDDAFGYIAAAFFVAYALSNAFSGMLIDRLGTRLGYALCMTFWTTAGLVHAFAITPFQFGVCRFFLGLGEAGNWPAALKLTTEWFPAHERSTASGIFNSGSALGAIIVPPMVAYLGTWYGWQSTFIILGVAGYLWVAVFWFMYYTPKTSVTEPVVRIVPPVKLLKTRFVSMFILAKVFLEPVWYFVTFWLGRYLADVYHLTLTQIGFYALLTYAIADLGNLIGGYFTQLLIKRGTPIPTARRFALGISGCIMGLPLLAGPFVITSPVTALIVIGLAGFGYTSYTANALALTADVFPKNTAASAWGLACIGNGIGGAIFQSLSGLTLVSFKVSNGYTFAYNILFIGFGISAFIGIAIMLFAMGPFHRNEEINRYVLAEDEPLNGS